jgi:hypothetical protein
MTIWNVVLGIAVMLWAFRLQAQERARLEEAPCCDPGGYRIEEGVFPPGSELTRMTREPIQRN